MSGWEAAFIWPNLTGLLDENDRLKFYHWCEDQFGPIDYGKSAGQWLWAVKGTSPVRLNFRYRRHAIMFKLRWPELVDLIPIPARPRWNVNTE